MAQRLSIIAIDDFYSNPFEVRSFALNQNFDIQGNFPGYRTKSFLNDTLKEAIQCVVYPYAGDITDWDENENSSCGSFQYTTEEHHSWIHCDGGFKWAAVVYLTPNAPTSAGTGFYKHKMTSIDRFVHLTETPTEKDLKHTYLRDYKDMTKWELTDVVSNKFNRLVLYDASMFHKSMDYFGKDKNSGRLFQVFFFNTNK